VAPPSLSLSLSLSSRQSQNYTLLVSSSRDIKFFSFLPGAVIFVTTLSFQPRAFTSRLLLINPARLVSFRSILSDDGDDRGLGANWRLTFGAASSKQEQLGIISSRDIDRCEAFGLSVYDFSSPPPLSLSLSLSLSSFSFFSLLSFIHLFISFFFPVKLSSLSSSFSSSLRSRGLQARGLTLEAFLIAGDANAFSVRIADVLGADGVNNAIYVPRTKH